MKIWQLIKRFIDLNRSNTAVRRTTAILAAITVFVTTYALILPAITLERSTTEDMPGLVLERSEDGQDKGAETGDGQLETTGVEQDALSAEHGRTEQEAVKVHPVSRTFTQVVSGASISLTFEDGADLDEDLIMNVTEIGTEEAGQAEYDQYYAATAAKVAEEMGVADTGLFGVHFYRVSFENIVQPAALEPVREIVIPTGSAVAVITRDSDEEAQTAAVAAVAFRGGTPELILGSDRVSGTTNAAEISIGEGAFDTIGVFSAPDFAAGSLTAAGADYSIAVNYPAFSGIGKDSSLSVRELAADSDEYAAYYQEMEAAIKAGIVSARLFDIDILDASGAKIQPKSQVNVSIKVDDPIIPADAEQKGEVQVVHISDTNKTTSVEHCGSDNSIMEEKVESLTNAIVLETVTVSDAADSNGQEVSFETDGFSIYGVAYTVDFEHELNGKVFRFSLNGNESISLSELAEQLGFIGESGFQNVDAFLAEVKDVTFSDEKLVRITKNEQNNDWTLESLQPFSTVEMMTITLHDGSIINVKVTDDADYTISIAFKDKDGNTESNPESNPPLTNVYLHILLERDGKLYYQNNPAAINGNQDIQVSSYKSWKGKTGEDLNNYQFKPTDQISVYTFLAQYDSNLNQDYLNDYGTIIESNGRKVYKDGDIIGGKYVLSCQAVEGGYSIVFQRPRPYTFSVKAMHGNDNQEDIVFTEGPWYLYAEVSRTDGTYFYVRKLENISKTEVTTIDKLERYTGVWNRQGETIHTDNDHLAFALVRPKDSGQSDQPGYFYTADNMNVKALSGSSVDSKYTLEVVNGESHSDLILRVGPEAAITLTSYDENNDLEGKPALEAIGSYFLVGELAFRDGLTDKRCYYVEAFNGNQSQTVDNISSFIGNNNDIQYLTGTRSFEPLLVFDPDTSATAEMVRNKLLNNDTSITIFRDGDPVEKYRMTSVSGTRTTPEGVIRLEQLPALRAAGEIQDKDGNKTTKTDNETYNLLVELTRGEKKAYAYQPLSFNSEGKMEPVPLTDAFKEMTSGATWYYSEEDTPVFYVVKGSVADHASAIQSKERYSADQLMGTYTPSFRFDEETHTVTTILKETDEITGTPYSVRIDMMNMEQDDVATVDPTLTGNYYVLASLTPKGTGSRGQVVAWSVLPVDLADLNPDGTWKATIPSDGFSVCNANLEPTGTKIGYNAEAFDISLRMYHSAISYGTYNDIRKNADDSAPGGYDFKGVYTKENDPVTGTLKLTEENASVIRLHKAYDKVYGIRAYVDHKGLNIPEGSYVVKVKLLHETGDPTYAFAKLKIEATAGENVPVELEFYKDDRNRIWRDQNGGLQDGSNYTFTGNEKGVELTLLSLNGTGSFAEWTKDPSQTSTYSVIHSGESINLYTFTFDKRENEENVEQKKNYVYDVLRFTEDVNGISKGELDEKLKQARDFGLYTENLSKHATDMEANIGAAVLSGEIGADYGFSGNNINVNRITVTKQYYENGNPVNKQVTLRLYPVKTYNSETGEYTLGTMIGEKQGNTNNDGMLQLIFDQLPAGKYVLKEVLNGKEYDFNYNGSTNGHIVDGNTVVQFQDRIIDIENVNVNYNYFGDITDNVSLPPVLSHSRHGLIVVGNDQDYEAFIHANGGETASDGTTVKKAGTDPDYPVLDIPADMEKLRELSNLLGVSANSKTVRIINTTYAERNGNSELKLKSDGRYIVVNIDMTDAPFVATVNLDTYIDGHRLIADFGANGNEDSSKVLYNFITRDAHGNISNYTGKINTATQAAGVILAPSAIVADLGGNWGGTIICKEAQHTGSEIHSDSANKIQKKNTLLINGEAEKGNLELIKSFKEPCDDRTTWFTFKVTARNADSTPLTGEYSATGLREGDKVTFDENGEASVLVRAQNKVFIVGLPVGVTYSVTEVQTPESEPYAFDHSNPENGSGTIIKNQTSSVEIVNKKNDQTCDLEIIKIVEGPIREESVNNLEFEVQILDNEGKTAGWLTKDGTVSTTEIKLNLSDGFTINKNAEGYVISAEKRFERIQPGNYKVIESHYEIEGYQFIVNQSVTEAGATIVAGETGTIEIKDVYEEPFEFTKIWKDDAGQDTEWPEKTDIRVTVHRKIDTTLDTAFTLQYTITKNDLIKDKEISPESGNLNLIVTDADNYIFQISGLTKNGSIGAVTGDYIYYVTEEDMDGYFARYQKERVATQDGAINGGVIINTPEDAYTLPSTGGPGSEFFMILGSILIFAAGVLLLRRRRMLKGGDGLL